MHTELLRHGAPRDALRLLDDTLQGKDWDRQRSVTRRSRAQCFPLVFFQIHTTLSLQVASDRSPLLQHRPRLKVVLRGPLDGTTPSLNEHTGAVIQTSQIQLSKHSNQSNLQP